MVIWCTYGQGITVYHEEKGDKKMKYMKLNFLMKILPILMVFLLSGCSKSTPIVTESIHLPTQSITTGSIPLEKSTQNPFPTPVITTSPDIFQTEKPTPLSTPINIATKTPKLPKNVFRFDNLSPDLYIVYSSLNIDDVNHSVSTLNLITRNGQMNGEIINLEPYRSPNFNIRISPDKKQIAFIDDPNYGSEVRILNLENQLEMLVPQVNGCIDIDWSPDSNRLILVCNHLYLFSIAENTLIRLISHEASAQGIMFNTLKWSPDGRWIVAHQVYDNVWNQYLGGDLYLVDTTCVSNVSSCLEKSHVIDKVRSEFFSPTWSPDSKFFAAFTSPGEISVWNINNSGFYKVKVPYWQDATVLQEWGYLAWSPDGEWFAYSQADSRQPDAPTSFDLYVIPVKGGTPRLVLDDSNIKLVMGWLSVQWPFQVGQAYTITSSGANINLREKPSLNGKVIESLQPGEFLTVLQGPLFEDGYHWWKMRTANEVDGWVVGVPDWYTPNIEP